MKTILPILFVLFSLPLSLLGQSSSPYIDSLMIELEKETDDSIRIELVSEIGWAYRNVNLEKAEEYVQQSLVYARENNDTWGQNRALYYLGVIYRKKGDLQTAIKYGKEILVLAEAEEDWQMVGVNCNSIGNAYSEIGIYDTSIIFHFKALEAYEKGDFTIKKASVYNNIGNSFQDQNREELAEEYFLKALDIYKKHDERKLVGMTLRNLGRVTSEHEKAMDYFNQALKVFEENNNLTGIATINTSIGAKLIKLERFEEAKPYYEKALKINEEVGNTRRMTTSYSSLGNIYRNLNMPQKAILHYQKALELSESSNYTIKKEEIFRNLSKLYAGEENFDKAYENLKNSKEIRDSLYNEKTLKLTSELEAKYDAKQKEAELASQQLQIEQQKNSRNRLLIGGILALLAITAVFQRYYYHQKRKKQEAVLALEIQKTEADSLRELDNLKTKFFANISHELRTPLTLIMSPLEEALQKAKEKSLENDLGLAHSNSKKLLNLVNEILDLSKLEAGKLELNERPVNLNQLTRRIFYSFQSLAHLRNLKLDLKYDLSEDLGVGLDVEKFEKILNNLLSNAIKHSKSGGSVQLAVRSQDFEKRQILVFKMKDSGEGIPEEDLNRVFDRFYQSKSGKMTGGTGIGLALSKELAQLFEGDLKVESEVGKGSVFTLEIPLKKASVKNVPNEIFEKQSSEAPIKTNNQDGYQSILLNGKKPKVLVVEDNLEMSDFLTKMLEPHYECERAFNGKEALTKLESNNFDLITSDVMMPEMDGFEFRETVNKNSNWRQTPFIMLTARALENDKLQGFDLGVDDYITKPFSSKELLARIENLLKNKSERDAFQKENGSENSKSEQPQSAEKELLKQTEKIVLDNLDDPTFKVTDLAKKIGYSQRQLARIIRKLTGLSPVNFILEIRLQKAYQLFQSRQFMTVSEVRYEIGIESAAYFTTKFKARFGKNPKEFLN